MIENGVVTLPVEEYNRLSNRATKYGVLINAMLGNACLDYDGELEFNETITRGVIRALDGRLYSARLYEVKREQENRRAENANV